MVKMGGGWIPVIFAVIPPTLVAIVAAFQAYIAMSHVTVVQNQLELAQAKFAEIERPTSQTTLRSALQIELVATRSIVLSELGSKRFTITLHNRGPEEIFDLAISLRLRVQERQSGEYEEREVASTILSSLHPSPAPIDIDLTKPARVMIRQYTGRLFPAYSFRFLVLHADWRSKAGPRVDKIRSYSIRGGRAL